MPVSDRDRKLLWARSGNQCAICKRPLAEDAQAPEDREAVIGVECHIVAQSPTGPRGGEITADELDRYGNLILLCGGDHTQVDQQSAHFTAARLRGIKRAHEQHVERRLSTETMPHMYWIDPTERRVELTAATTGAELLRYVTNSEMFSFDEPDYASDEEAEVVASLIQDLSDFGDIWDDIGPGNQSRERHEMTARVREVMAYGLMIYVGTWTRHLVVDGQRSPFKVAVTQFARLPDDLRAQLRSLIDDELSAEPDASPSTPPSD